jgi:hypothetical protein
MRNLPQFGFARQHSSDIIIAPYIPYIVQEPDAPAWVVVHRSFGWSFGSRREAIAARDEIAREVR